MVRSENGWSGRRTGGQAGERVLGQRTGDQAGERVSGQKTGGQAGERVAGRRTGVRLENGWPILGSFLPLRLLPQSDLLHHI